MGNKKELFFVRVNIRILEGTRKQEGPMSGTLIVIEREDRANQGRRLRLNDYR